MCYKQSAVGDFHKKRPYFNDKMQLYLYVLCFVDLRISINPTILFFVKYYIKDIEK